ncbi:MAG: hypothetical protein ACHP9V_07500 [Terriglobales bacterium]
MEEAAEQPLAILLQLVRGAEGVRLPAVVRFQVVELTTITQVVGGDPRAQLVGELADDG